MFIKTSLYNHEVIVWQSFTFMLFLISFD